MLKRTEKILFIQRDLNPPGGGHTVAVWMLEALKDLYDVTVLTWAPPDYDKINGYYGTSLAPEDLTCRIPPALLRRAVDRIPNDPWKYQQLVFLQRWAKSIGRRYDTMVAADNEFDFGRRGIQYVHFPYHEDTWAKESIHRKTMRWPRLTSDVVKARLRPWRLVSGFSFERMRHNLTLVNSDWTGARWRQAYGTGSVTVFPPVPGLFSGMPWDEREDGFVCLGRFSREKRYERLIDILAAVRRQFPDLHLHIVGSRVDYDADAYRDVKRKVQANASWVCLHEDLSREELVTLVTRHRYGIHGMIDEHFGIAVAELVRGGCIPFVPWSGGQVEILGHESDLLYRDDDEAVAKIRRVLHCRRTQAGLRERLSFRAHLFTTDTFTQRIRDIVKGYTANENARTQ